jgi:nodulation protein E
MLVLENSETARARGAKIYAEVIGFGMSSDANHLVEPSAVGAAASIRASLADAGVVAQDVDYINAHGSGTLANDSTETSAIHIVFAEHAANLACQLHQIHARARSGGGGGAGSDRHRDGHRASNCAADRQLSRCRSRLRSRLCAQHGASLRD